ncbi:hypothetical protein D0Y65_040984 [Glycine soja]|uniref:Uncharacterized protein n=1 Tax=Glycine soja TaxID=3848 RepID=A0A445GTU7_GLYSO|nr:hypothetical protein D0Y65_040984 [Glycine soja]
MSISTRPMDQRSEEAGYSSSDLIEERNGGSTWTMTREGHEGDDGRRGVPHQLLEASRKRLSSSKTSRICVEGYLWRDIRKQVH